MRRRLGQVGNTARRDCARAVRFAVIAGDIDDRQTYPAIREAPAQLDAGFSIQIDVHDEANAVSKSP